VSVVLHINQWRGWRQPGLQILLALAAVTLVQVCYGLRTFDDAYITYRYARNLSQGLGFVYNVGQTVLGTTTPLYTLLLAGLSLWVGASALPLTAWCLGIVLEGLNFWLVGRIAQDLLGDWRAAVLAALVYLLQPLHINVASGGMETALFTACLLLLYRSFRARRSGAAALWAALAFLTRPDAVLAIGLVFLFWLWLDWRAALRFGVAASLMVLPWLVFAMVYFGSPIPHSIIAKSAAYAHLPPTQALLFLLTFFGTGTLDIQLPVGVILIGGAACGLLSILGATKLRRLDPTVWASLAYPLLYLLTMSVINPALWFPWYFIPLMPGALWLLFGAPLALPPRLRGPAWLALALALVGLPLAAQQISPHWDSHRIREQTYLRACAEVQDQLSPRARVLAPDIGVVGWCLADALILDPIGLVSPEALAYLPDLGSGEWVSARLVREQQPDAIFGLDFYLQPTLLGRPWFEAQYRPLWQQRFTISEEIRTLYVFARSP